MISVKRFTWALSLVILACAPIAHAGTYFEYAPDPWQSYRLAVSTGAAPYQFFQSASDFELTDFSFWVDNTGSSGDVTFTLLDDQNTTLVEKTVTLGQTPAIPGGTRLRVQLTNPISISHYRTYSIQISSNLLGFGLYYANRINILEHNLQYTTEYALGVAAIGSEQQSYTFKFALGDPTENGNGDTELSEETPVSEETPTSTAPTATTITNARITSITGTTAVAAWTTNVAADSRTTVRSQLNPLYVYTTAYDDALELEHTLILTGLTPNTGYFVDFFSQQNSDEPILTTYSVSFTTGNLTDDEAEAAQEATASASSTTSSSTGQTSSTSQQTTNATSTSTTNATTSLPAVVFSPGTSGDSFTVNWQAPAGGTPNGGYRIDIFDEDHRLIRQLHAPSDATSRNVAILPPGSHEVVVYADQDGVYTKVAAPTSFEAEKARSPLFWFWYLMGVILSLLIAFAFLFSRREKTELPSLE